MNLHLCNCTYVCCISVVWLRWRRAALLIPLPLSQPFKKVFWPREVTSAWCVLPSIGYRVISPSFFPCLFPCKNNFKRSQPSGPPLIWSFWWNWVVGNGRKWCVYLKAMTQKEGLAEAEQFLRKQITASAQRSEVREGTEASEDLSLLNLIHTFMLNVIDSLGEKKKKAAWNT